MLNILLVTLGLARAHRSSRGCRSRSARFSPGMLIAETEYRYQVEEDIKPFRDVLLGLFFVTVGMYLDLTVVGQHFGWVCLLLLGPVLAKLALIVRVGAESSAHRSAPRCGPVSISRRPASSRIVLLAAVDATWASSTGRCRSWCWRRWCCRCCRHRS